MGKDIFISGNPSTLRLISIKLIRQSQSGLLHPYLGLHIVSTEEKVTNLHKYITEHVTLFFSHMVITPLGRTVTLASRYTDYAVPVPTV